MAGILILPPIISQAHTLPYQARTKISWSTGDTGDASGGWNLGSGPPRSKGFPALNKLTAGGGWETSRKEWG